MSRLARALVLFAALYGCDGCDDDRAGGKLDSGASRDGGRETIDGSSAPAVDGGGPTAGTHAGDAGPDAGPHAHPDGGLDAGALALPEPPALAVDAETRVVALQNARGEPFYAVLAEPRTAGPHPAVMVLHGSGGLYRMPEAEDIGTCSPELESQFVRWAERLVGLGFVVLMPDSFGPRGFCDDNDDPRRAAAFPANAVDEDGKTRRLLARIYDADAALRDLVARSSVDAGAVALLGFSNGASTAALYVHHRLGPALQEFAASDDGLALGVTIPALPGPVPALRQSIAYYPGCGFDGLLPFSLDGADVAEFFCPAVPLRIEHASLDPLVGHCSKTGQGTRELQAEAYATAMSLPDRYDVVVHDGAHHGFDAEGCELPDAGPGPDTQACGAALATTLSLLQPLLMP